ncbi:restriction endonuclease subunit S [Streptosporangium sp. H16]|uniref:restriction endonuclease subunit S n=1 Tax=Streptosporangium sp. H16 TaxID=3444184 RepID=UPI003F79D187
MSDELPDGWVWTTLEGLLAAEPRAITDGPFGSNLKSSHYTDTGARVLRLQNVGDGEFRDERAYISLDHYEALKTHNVQAGDLILASLGEELPRVALVPDLDGPAIVKADVIRARLHPAVSSKWVLYAVQAPATRAVAMSKIKGVGRPRLGLSEIRKLPIPLPPLAEQHRIVGALEDHLSRLYAGSHAIIASSRRLTRLRTRLMSAITSQPHPSMTSTTVGAIARQVRNGISISRPGKDPIGIPILRIGAVRALALDLTDLRYTGIFPESNFPSHSLLNPGDLLFTRYNGNPEYVGSCAVVPDGIEPLTYPDKLIRVEINQSYADPRYVALACSAGRSRDFIRQSVKTTAGQAGISGRDLKAAPLELPDLAEQQRRVERFDEAHRGLLRLGHALTFTSQRSENLRRSLLAEAFAGKLIPQDPADEPASELLKRIETERNSQPKTTRTRKPATAKKMIAPPKTTIVPTGTQEELAL